VRQVPGTTGASVATVSVAANRPAFPDRNKCRDCESVRWAQRSLRPVVSNKLDRGFPRAKVVGTSGMTQLPRALRQPPASAELAAALGACRRSFMAIALFSGMSNILMLTGSLFMLEVYDRVLPSRRVPTLVALLMLAGGLYAAQGIIDAIRRRILVRVGNSLDETLSLRVYDAIVRLRFLTPMTNAIIERKGTIDKYIGDAIMAFWNAPLGRRRAGSKCL
jgi:hypothetical protein